MPLIIALEELEQFRSRLADFPEVLSALDTIEDCDGDLEDAAISLAIQAGMEPTASDRWLEGLAKRCRAVICRADVKPLLQHGLTADILTAIAENTTLPLKLATPVALYVLKTGVQTFCQPFEDNLPGG